MFKQMLAVCVFYIANVQFPDIFDNRSYLLFSDIFIYLQNYFIKNASVIYFMVSEIYFLTNFVKQYAILS